jgi:hypothetical protein
VRRWMRDLALIGLIVAGVVLWRSFQHYPTGVFDFYPLYWGGKAWLATGNAYNLAAVVPASHHGYQLFIIGNIYPLPAVLLTLPLTVLPPQAASLVWIGLLAAGVMLTLRLLDGPWWFVATLPIIEGVRIEQYTPAILAAQLLALWALRSRRYWLLGGCVAVMLTKPNQGLLFALMLVLVSRAWLPVVTSCAVLWGGSLLLDPHWVVEWLPTLVHHHDVLHQTLLWPLALLALPLLLWRDWISAAVLGQFALLPWSGIYAASALPIGIFDAPLARWWWPASWLWIVAAPLVGQPWGVALTMAVPVVIISAQRAGWRPQKLRWMGWLPGQDTSNSAVSAATGDAAPGRQGRDEHATVG